MGNFIPVEPEKWAEMVKAAAASDYWRIEAETDHARWLRTLEENEKLRAEVERLRKDTSMMLSVYSEHYERLRKAGDAMAERCLKMQYTEVPWEYGPKWYAWHSKAEASVQAWNDAKEGKPSV